VPESNYADNFGLQWNRFRKTQLDSHSGLPISKQRLLASTAWDWNAMAGKRILDIGCGAGRFSEVALEFAASVVGVDYSDAVDAAYANLSHYEGFEAIQASVYELPFRPESFDYVYCLGVLQHTPDPAKAFSTLVGLVKPGGRIAIDVYPLVWRNLLWSKYWLRPLTKRLPGPLLMRMVEGAVPTLLFLSRAISTIPLIGRKLSFLLPVANYERVYPLSETQLREWAILDTFDMLSPKHDHPKSAKQLARWFQNANLTDVEIFKKGHLIGRGVRKGLDSIGPQV
jgi:SAM-dependent methyltransferase